jgi:AbrB family looped-hinge helix DNA binding protein
MSPNGRIVIPAAIRDALNLKVGETLLLEAADGVLRIESFAQRLRQIQDEVIQMVGSERSLADELIAERREEARREQAEPGQQINSVSDSDSLRKAS